MSFRFRVFGNLALGVAAAFLLYAAPALAQKKGGGSTPPPPPAPNPPGTILYLNSHPSVWGMNGDGSNKTQVPTNVFPAEVSRNAVESEAYAPSNLVYGPSASRDRILAWPAFP
jgi:hypothetical protein